ARPLAPVPVGAVGEEWLAPQSRQEPRQARVQALALAGGQDHDRHGQRQLRGSGPVPMITRGESGKSVLVPDYARRGRGTPPSWINGWRAVRPRGSAPALALELLRGAVPRLRLDQRSLRLLEVDLALAALERLAGALAGLERGGHVELLGAERAVRRHGHEARLHLEHAAGDGHEELGPVVTLHADLAGAQVRQQRRVP